MKIGITQKTPLGDQADSLIPITAIINITEEKIRNVIAERAVDQKIPSRDSKRCFAFLTLARLARMNPALRQNTSRTE